MAGSANISYGYVGDRNTRNSAPQFTEAAGGSEVLATNETTSTPSVGAAASTAGEQSRQMSVRIVLSEEGYIKIGSGTPVADKTASIRMVANVPEYFSILPGQKVAVIDSA